MEEDEGDVVQPVEGAPEAWHEGFQDPLTWLLDSLIRDEVAELDLPHLVLCHRGYDERPQTYGPFASVLDALRVADREGRYSVEHDLELTFEVVPLFPTSGLDA